jgi:hypothetical protein
MVQGVVQHHEQSPLSSCSLEQDSILLLQYHLINIKQFSLINKSIYLIYTVYIYVLQFTAALHKFWDQITMVPKKFMMVLTLQQAHDPSEMTGTRISFFSSLSLLTFYLLPLFFAYSFPIPLNCSSYHLLFAPKDEAERHPSKLH